MKNALIALSMLALPCISFGQYGVPVFIDTLNITDKAHTANFFEHNGKLYFTAKKYMVGSDFWVTDGVPGTTKLLKDLPGDGILDNSIVSLGTNLLFSCHEISNNDHKLWVSDGTTAGTHKLLDINSVAYDQVKGLTVHNGEVYFAASEGPFGDKLRVTNATVAGTVKVADLGPESTRAGGFRIFNNKLYFFTFGSMLSSPALWVTDGTLSGTEPVQGMQAGQVIKFNYLAEYNGKLYFTIGTNFNYWELWSTDGTTAGTTKVKSLFGEQCFQNAVVFNNKLYFYNFDGQEADVWMTDGTEFGTVLVINGTVSVADPAKWYKLFPWKYNLYFTGNIQSNGLELYVSDGTAAGTNIVKDINPSGDAYISSITAYNGRLYFGASDGNYDLWTTDGTDAGTHKIVVPGASAVNHLDQDHFTMFEYNDSLYFEATYDPAIGAGLYCLYVPALSVKEMVSNNLHAAIYPNPTYGAATLDYKLQTAGETTVTVTDVTGKIVFSSIENETPGKHTVQINLTSTANGMYFVKLEHNEETTVLKLSLQ